MPSVNLFFIAVLSALSVIAPQAGAQAGPPDAALVDAGRAVYVAEGCIHCHSQFIRPGTPDVERWGPARALDDVLKESPPLLGNRRQGPDLANVGNRRTTEWNRLHLIAPRSISPGSRMPAYAHLFRAGETRGEALLAYLESLGADTQSERATTIAAWTPPADSTGTPALGRQLFAQLCANCHGSHGHGDGPVAARLTLRPPDWPQHGWRRLPHDLPAGTLDTELARLIKFGAPGTPMAGHEALTERELVSLVAHVRSLQPGAK